MVNEKMKVDVCFKELTTVTVHKKSKKIKAPFYGLAIDDAISVTQIMNELVIYAYDGYYVVCYRMDVKQVSVLLIKKG